MLWLVQYVILENILGHLSVTLQMTHLLLPNIHLSMQFNDIFSVRFIRINLFCPMSPPWSPCNRSMMIININVETQARRKLGISALGGFYATDSKYYFAMPAIYFLFPLKYFPWPRSVANWNYCVCSNSWNFDVYLPTLWKVK